MSKEIETISIHEINNTHTVLHYRVNGITKDLKTYKNIYDAIRKAEGLQKAYAIPFEIVFKDGSTRRIIVEKGHSIIGHI